MEKNPREPQSNRAHERWAQFRFSVIGTLLAAPPQKGRLQEQIKELAAKPGLSRAAKENFTEYLENGGGLAIIHYANGSWYLTNPSGLTAYWTEYAGIICRRYWDHSISGHDPYGEFTVRITGQEHPIIDGLRGLSFDTKDELYFKQQGELPIEALAVAKSAVTGADEPMAFAYDYGEGRVFQTVLGHAPESILAGGTSLLIRRGALWAAGAELEKADPGAFERDVPADDGGAPGEARHKPPPTP